MNERPAVRGERLLALDAFRGMTVAGMLLVNNPGNWSAIYPPLEHAPWNGWTPTDMVFPFFLFIVGITTELSLEARRARGDDERAILRQIVKRGTLIFLFGVLLAWFPFYQYQPIDGLPDATVLDRVIFRIEHLRILGVLQRIGLAYLFGALITVRTSLKTQIAVLVVLLFGYWVLMTLVPVPGTGVPGRFVFDKPDQLLSAWIDRTLLGTNHLWIGSTTWDPEGLLSTVPAIGTMILGTFAGKLIGKREMPLNERLATLFSAGSMAMVAGLVWNWVFPINKSLWTSSYVMFSGGMAAVVLATCLWVVDVRGLKGWTRPFVVYGLNPMIAFLGSTAMARTMGTWVNINVNDTRTPLQTVVYDSAFGTWLSPVNASLAYAIAFVLFWYVLLLLAQKRGVMLKV